MGQGQVRVRVSVRAYGGPVERVVATRPGEVRAFNPLVTRNLVLPPVTEVALHGAPASHIHHPLGTSRAAAVDGHHRWVPTQLAWERG